jgi:Prolyl 4-Hydroxylase alpha-subunit, N-terminal region
MMFLVTLILLSGAIDGGLSHNGKTLDEYIATEKSFIGDLENYIDAQESVLQLLRKKLLNFKVERSDANENPKAYFSNELNKFLLVKRLASDINLLSEKTFAVANRFKLKADAYKNDKTLPTKDDLKESALSIANLQKAKNLRTDKLAKGIFGSIKRR